MKDQFLCLGCGSKSSNCASECVCGDRFVEYIEESEKMTAKIKTECSECHANIGKLHEKHCSNYYKPESIKLECGECLAKENEYHEIWCPNKPNVKIGSNLEEECEDAYCEDMNEANDGDAIPIPPEISGKSIRTFTSGATRHVDDKKHDYEGFLSPWALRRFGEYMHSHRIQADGSKRDSDNWQKGIPVDQYMKSLLRHTLDAWSMHRGLRTFDTKDSSEVDVDDALCAILFNAFGYLHEILKEKK